MGFVFIVVNMFLNIGIFYPLQKNNDASTTQIIFLKVVHLYELLNIITFD
jgi:hypothetical protein